MVQGLGLGNEGVNKKIKQRRHIEKKSWRKGNYYITAGEICRDYRKGAFLHSLLARGKRDLPVPWGVSWAYEILCLRHLNPALEATFPNGIGYVN